MANTVTLPQSEYKEITTRLSRLEKMMSALLKEVEKEPSYGSDAWWEWSIKKSKEEYQKGDYYELRNKKELDDFFKHSDDDTYVYRKFHHKSRKTAQKTSKTYPKEVTQAVATA